MKIVDIFTPFNDVFAATGDLRKALNQPALRDLSRMAMSWGGETENLRRWMASPEYGAHRAVAQEFLKVAPEAVKKIEALFGGELKGELRLGPSLMQFDGFARYDSGSHTVWFGMDHPDADQNYLKALLAHELSHVYRDHQPQVWKVFGKPLEKVTRTEYLDQMDYREHLVSEGLATLFSQVAYPEVPLHVHHYYSTDEMRWCLENRGRIDKALSDCIKGDQDVWKFYDDEVVAPGSPSRTQYFWAAQKIAEWFSQNKKNNPVIEAHGWPSKDFSCF